MNKKSLIVIGVILVVMIIAVFISQRMIVEAPISKTVAPVEVYENASKDMIGVDSLRAGNTIKSPLSLTGTALGNWYFEGSFPIEVRDSSGAVVGQTIGVAQSDWMVSTGVPFQADVMFTTTATSGSIVLKNDNPSGDPIRDRALIIPIMFGNK